MGETVKMEIKKPNLAVELFYPPYGGLKKRTNLAVSLFIPLYTV